MRNQARDPTVAACRHCQVCISPTDAARCACLFTTLPHANLRGNAMNHVPKQQWMGCAVAAAAMLAGRRYEEVAAHWPDLDEASTRSPRELCALLEAVTDHEWYLAPCWNKRRVHEFSPPRWAVAAW